MATVNILYIITKSNYGGAQKYIFELASAAKDAGHDVSVACGGTGEADAALGLLADKLIANNIPVHPIRNFLRNMSLLNDMKALFEVWRLIRHQKPDVLHVTSSKAGGIGALAGRFALVPRIVFTSHGLTVDEVWRPRWQRILIYLRDNAGYDDFLYSIAKLQVRRARDHGIARVNRNLADARICGNIALGKNVRYG